MFDPWVIRLRFMNFTVAEDLSRVEFFSLKGALGAWIHRSSVKSEVIYQQLAAEMGCTTLQGLPGDSITLEVTCQKLRVVTAVNACGTLPGFSGWADVNGLVVSRGRGINPCRTHQTPCCILMCASCCCLHPSFLRFQLSSCRPF